MTRLHISSAEVVKAAVRYQMRDPKAISGEIVGKRTTVSSLVLLQDNSERRTLRISEDAVIKKGNRTLKFNDLKKGDLITAKYHQTREGAFIFSSPKQPAVVQQGTALVEPVQVAVGEPARMLPETASAYPLILLMSLFAGTLAIGIGIYRK